ncbi:MAG: Carbamate kinase 2 [Syntrophorhabdaceae bacterium PtaU1.Bin034]|nr:MAG: Carbamate kinase 2 [Syntrophorhabdaceae bacterium PtaU1.Bin034]
MKSEGKKVVIALGGNAINLPHQRGTFKEQYDHIRSACVPIMELIRNGVSVVLTHGSGPQVGNLLIQEDAAADLVPPQPTDICAAMVQGQVGYMIQQAISNTLIDIGLSIEAVTVISRVLIREDDPAFANPSKPVGPFYTADQAARYVRERGYTMKQIYPGNDRSFRRVVPSPYPLGIIEKNIIRHLVAEGTVVIACGGGGIPVYLRKNGHYHGVEAVVDKDLCAAKLGEEVGADILLILTDTSYVWLNFASPEATPLVSVDLHTMKGYLKEGQFLEGTMKPKVEACVRFLETGGERAVIASLADVAPAFQGTAGTQIIPGGKRPERKGTTK